MGVVMAKPRISQFAKDLSISKDKAKQLIQRGRSMRDGGSQVIEKHIEEVHSRGGGKAIQGTIFRGVR